MLQTDIPDRKGILDNLRDFDQTWDEKILKIKGTTEGIEALKQNAQEMRLTQMCPEKLWGSSTLEIIALPNCPVRARQYRKCSLVNLPKIMEKCCTGNIFRFSLMFMERTIHKKLLP